MEAQVDLEGTLGDIGTRLFIDGKSAASIGTAEYDQLERYAALAKDKNGEVVWILEGQPTANFYAHAQDMMARYDVRIHLIDADTGASFMPIV